MSSCHHHPIVGRGPKIGGPQNGWETLQAKFFARYGITTAQAGHGRSPSPVRLMEHPLLSFIIYGMKHGLYMDYTYSMTHIKAIFHPIYIYICTPRIRFVRCTSKFSKCLRMPVGSAPWYAAFTSRDVKGAGSVFESYIFIR
jgi:hypothetical protein